MLTIATACSGTDVVLAVLDVLRTAWSKVATHPGAPRSVDCLTACPVAGEYGAGRRRLCIAMVWGIGRRCGVSGFPGYPAPEIQSAVLM